MDMDMGALYKLTLYTFEFLALLFVVSVGVAVFALAWMYIVDITQKQHTVRRNYPVIGRFRYLFEHLGEFFRQYFFAMDREELPFNRAQRSWVYRAAKDIDSTVAFGSSYPLNQPGNFIFLNGAFPPLQEQYKPRAPVTYGAGYAEHPYTTSSIFNVSAMSFGALSVPPCAPCHTARRRRACG